MTSRWAKLYPPRARTAMPPDTLDRFRGFLAQYKYNDIRTLFHFSPGEIELLTRRREPVREYRLTPAMREALSALRLDRSKFHVLDGGILRHLLVRGENPIVLWDVLVLDNQHLVGTSYASRYALLESICNEPRRFETDTGRRVGLEIRPFLWLAPCFSDCFREIYRNALGADFLEGLMLKNPGARLEPGFRETNNTSWQIKIRKSAKAYMF